VIVMLEPATMLMSPVTALTLVTDGMSAKYPTRSIAIQAPAFSAIRRIAPSPARPTIDRPVTSSPSL
jgi:hypothetical protein